ncbi:endopeptidase La [bacterium]|nr:endopeptidase La [bacterium]
MTFRLVTLFSLICTLSPVVCANDQLTDEQPDVITSQLKQTENEAFLLYRLLLLSKGINEGQIQKIQQQIRSLWLNEEAENLIYSQLDRLTSLPPFAPEAQEIRNHLEWIVSLPWNNKTIESRNQYQVQEYLDEVFYGAQNVKDRIVDFLALKHLQPDAAAPVICLVGPPGTGKTYLAQQIAQALNRTCSRVELGGMYKEHELVGRYRTVPGAYPGSFIKAIRQAGSNNPVFILENIDKITQNLVGGLPGVLTSVLDTEQNGTFRDTYIDVPFDFSSTIFIATANRTETIPEILRNRMEIFYIPGYSQEEKIIIANKHLLPAITRDFSLEQAIYPSDEALAFIIKHYTQEYGVRNLRRTLKRLYTKSVRSWLEQRRPSQMDGASIREYLGPYLVNNISEEEEEYADLPESEAYRRKISKLGLDEKALKEINKQIDLFSKMSIFSPEAEKIRAYLNIVLEVPWNVSSEDIFDIAKAEEVLDGDHYGLKEVKNRILDFLSVLSLKKDGITPILCLVGPPGTGKTSLGQSIAASLGREYQRVALGGVDDESEIRGHRRTYTDSMPGRFVKALCRAGTNNPVIVIDEIDKLVKSFRSNPESALLELLDPEQNKEFVDHYLDIPFDMSKVLFVTTANDLSTIARPLLDRMEVIEVSGYTPTEKMHIAQDHLIPSAIDQTGLSSDDVQVSDELLITLIEQYTFESGVRGLNKLIIKLCSKIARAKVELGQSLTFTPDNLVKHLGAGVWHMPANTQDKVGVVNGLAASALGGSIARIEASLVPGSGKLTLTGNLGQTLKESADIAYTYLRAHSTSLDIEPEKFTDYDIHIHLPSGGVSKDGPSGGVTLVSVILSVLTGKPIRSDYAMTGEISLQGNVLPIGGVKEKLLAVQRNHIPNVLLPIDNKKDILELDDVTKDMNIIWCSHVNDVIEHVWMHDANTTELAAT